jgi:hypothetical protein
MIDLIPEFAANVPKLNFLTVSAPYEYVVGLKANSSSHTPHPDFPHSQPDGYLEQIHNTNWKGFKALETVVWSVRVYGRTYSRSPPALPEMRGPGSFGEGEAFASAISGVRATLTTFIFVGRLGQHTGYRREDDGMMSKLAGG